MPQIRRLYFAMVTRNREDAGTDSALNLVINELGVDRVNHRFRDSAQQDQERGHANLYSLDLDETPIVSGRLNDGSVRVGVVGDDVWEPETLFLWGDAPATDDGVLPRQIVPLAIETDVTTKLSTNDAGAIPSLPIRLIPTGDRDMPVARMYLILITAGSLLGDDPIGEEGTNSRIQLSVATADGLVVQHSFGDTSQDDLEVQQANFYTVPVAVPFTVRSLLPDGIRLSILGNDAWLPSSLFLFGLDTRTGRPRRMVPLVHLERWGDRAWLSSDSSEGQEEIILPVLRSPDLGAPPIILPTRT